jgi:sugar lactone lactonase YvrE
LLQSILKIGCNATTCAQIATDLSGLAANMTQYQVEIEARALLAEGPRWHNKEARLYWVDIARNTLNRFDPVTKTNESRCFDTPIGCLAFIADGGFILAMKDGFARLAHWNAEPEDFGEQIFRHKPDVRFNDGRTDAQGRFWAGSVNTAKSAQDAALYRLDGDGSISEIEGGMLTCNGAAFSPDGLRFCHTDTPSHAVRIYDVNGADGTLSNARIYHQFPMGRGRPDGGSFDAEGYYWTALFDGGRVVRISPEGTVVREVALPVSRPTMIAFGGNDLCTAYVTTASIGLSEAQLQEQPLAGALFSFRVDVPGIPEADFVLR